MKQALLVVLLMTGTLSAGNLPAADPMKSSLQEKMEKLAAGVRGDVGIYVRHLKTGETAAVEADSLFPTASMIKVPIAVGIFDKIEKGELVLDQELTYDPEKISYPYDGGSLISSLRTGESVQLNKLILLMLALSDNHASLWCQSLAGTGVRINELMTENGFDQIRVNSRTEGRHANWQQYGWGQTTPRQMAELVAAIRAGKIVNPWASERLYRFLSGTVYHEEAISAIPLFVQTATKQGAVDQSRSEVVLVNAPSGDYVFCVITKNQEDQSWSLENEGYVLIRQVSQALWKHFEPESDWKPATQEAVSKKG